jgi:hypothetical protein
MAYFAAWRQLSSLLGQMVLASWNQNKMRMKLSSSSGYRSYLPVEHVRKILIKARTNLDFNESGFV